MSLKERPTYTRRQILQAALGAGTGALLSIARSTPSRASAPKGIEQTNCGTDWFDPSQTCMCDYVKGNPPMTVRQASNGLCGGQQTQKNTVPDPASEQNRTGLNREIGGSTAAVIGSVFLILLSTAAYKIVSALNDDMPN